MSEGTPWAVIPPDKAVPLELLNHFTVPRRSAWLLDLTTIPALSFTEKPADDSRRRCEESI